MENIKNDLIEKLELPKDIFLNDAMIGMYENHELQVENFKGIVSFDNGKIVLQTKQQLIVIVGEKLEIVFYTNQAAKISGKIACIEFQH